MKIEGALEYFVVEKPWNSTVFVYRSEQGPAALTLAVYLDCWKFCKLNAVSVQASIGVWVQC